MFIKHIHAFVLGIVEYRSAFTTNMGFTLERSYDRGRHLAHVVTMRLYDR